MGLVALALSVAGCAADHSKGEDDGKIDSGVLDVEIFPHKLYSAYIEGSDQVFQVPAIVAGVKADSWQCDDPDAVDLDMAAVPNGVMITTRKAGTFKIRATSGRNVGQVELEVSEATEEQLQEGLFLYNKQVDHMSVGRNSGGWMLNASSCKSCHTGRSGGLAIEYTPQQIGGFSDDELKALFSMGKKLPGTTYGSLPAIESFFPSFHQWAGTDSEYQALVVYLRSFRPISQDELDFD
ncbi:MAG TPA: hypothetical protein VJV78_08805 [Polyangiales bacterium]|nr:hypothetical protein [Polyangiales bacterium]